jgi:predicted outer membrane protein
MKRILMMSAAGVAALALVAFLPGQMLEAHAGYEDNDVTEEREVRPGEHDEHAMEEEIVEEERAVVPRAQVPEQREVLEMLRNLNQQEIQLGQLAAQRGASPEVQAFGRQLVQEHQQLQQQLQQIEQQLGQQPARPGQQPARPGQQQNPGTEMQERPVQPEEEALEEELPVGPDRPGMREMQQAVDNYIQGLQQAEGLDFDAGFLALQAGLHTNAVHMLTTAREAYQGEPLGRLAEQLIPRMEQHLQRTIQLAQQAPRVEG